MSIGNDELLEKSSLRKKTKGATDDHSENASVIFELRIEDQDQPDDDSNKNDHSADFYRNKSLQESGNDHGSTN